MHLSIFSLGNQPIYDRIQQVKANFILKGNMHKRVTQSKMLSDDTIRLAQKQFSDNTDNKLIVRDKLLLSWTQIHPKVCNVKTYSHLTVFSSFCCKGPCCLAESIHEDITPVNNKSFKATEMKAYADNRLWEERNICDTCQTSIVLSKSYKKAFQLTSTNVPPHYMIDRSCEYHISELSNFVNSALASLLKQQDENLQRVKHQSTFTHKECKRNDVTGISHIQTHINCS